jgi:hypothetical protein
MVVGKNEMTKQFLAVEDLTSLVLSRVRQRRHGRHVIEICVYEGVHLERN